LELALTRLATKAVWLDGSIALLGATTCSVLLMVNKCIEIHDCAKWDCIAFLSMSFLVHIAQESKEETWR
jgi:hypothetical protein